MNNSNAPITLYLADDHQIIIDGLKLLISEEASMSVVGYANNGETAFKEIATKKPDIAFIDISMPPGMNGLELMHKLLKSGIKTKFIILSMHDGKRDIKDALNGGASGYLFKNTGKAELMNCLLTVLKGGQYFPTIATKKDIPKSIFTPREFEIIRLIILQQYTTSQIAEHLCLSPLTVETHRKNIGRKTNTSTPLGLVKFLDENKIEL